MASHGEVIVGDGLDVDALSVCRNGYFDGVCIYVSENLIRKD